VVERSWTWVLVEEELEEDCLKARPPPCPGTQRAGRVDDSQAARLVSKVVSEAAGSGPARKDLALAAGCHKPDSSERQQHSVRSELAGSSV